MSISNKRDSYKINSDYLDDKEYNHNEVMTVHLEAYDYGYDGVKFYFDLTDRLIDYSYDCDSQSDIRQSASVTVYIGDWHDFEPVRWEHQAVDWIYEPVAGDGAIIKSVTWNKLLYRMYITYNCKDTGDTGRIEFGYFSPTSSDYSYDASTSTITISLSGLSAMLTSEYGGGILGSHTKIPKTDEKGNSQYDEHGHQIYITIPSVMSLGEGSSLDDNLINWILNPKWENDENSSMNISDVVPIAGVITETIGVGVRFWNLPHDIDFETDVSRMDMIKKVLELCYDEERGSTWIDENRILHVSGRQELRRYNSPVVYWRDISKLVISQSVNAEDTGFYNVVEVYGKDNEYYAIGDYSHLDNLFRKKTMTFSELMSDEECQIRANWEAYKSRYGHESISVTLVNRYVAGFNNPSNKVGRTIEIETPDGELNLFWLDKISYSGNTITLSLSYFIPLYDDLNYRYINTLSVPYISGHKVLDNNVLRLYIDGEDIDYGVVRLYEYFKFRKCSVQRDEDGRRYVDFEYKHSGEYGFTVNLYSPYYETSGFGGSIPSSESAYKVTVEYIPSRVPVDPYPHPDSTASTNEYLVNEMNEKLTDENGQRIYI